jgi:hypothetical protein
MTTITQVRKARKQSAREIKIIKAHICDNKKKLDFLLGNNGSRHEIFVRRERISYWSSKLPS